MTPSGAAARDTVTVIGIGYVGLAVAVAAGSAGYRVFGLDTDPERVAQVQSGQSPVETVTGPQLASISSLLTATTDPGCLKDSDYILVCVPTGVDAAGSADLGHLVSAARTVARYLRPGQCVIIESTTYPGTTETVIRPLLETSGLRAGHDFSLAYSPERIDPGNSRYNLRNTPKVVGGLTVPCRDRAVSFYRNLVARVHPTGLAEAEAAKLLENTFRQVNIALVNEFAQLCRLLGVDAQATIDAAATKPFGFMAFRPGPGVGGHCIPVAPRFLIDRARVLGTPFRLAEIAHEINEGMAGWFADRICERLAKIDLPARPARVLLLGATYKPDVADTRNSQAVGLLLALGCRGVVASFHDPYVAVVTVGEADLKRVENLKSALAGSDLAVLVQPHRCYDHPTLALAPALFDARRAFSESGPG